MRRRLLRRLRGRVALRVVWMGVARLRLVELRWLGRVLVGVWRRVLLVGLVSAGPTELVHRVLLVDRAGLVTAGRLELVGRVLVARLMVGVLAVARRRAMRGGAVRRWELPMARRRGLVDQLTVSGLVVLVPVVEPALLVRRVGRPRLVEPGRLAARPARRRVRAVRRVLLGRRVLRLEVGVGVRRLRVVRMLRGIGPGLGLMSPVRLLG